MLRYRVIEIINIEPVKIGAGGSKSNQTEPSKDYIPGSTIRGAFIGELVRKKLFNEQKHKILSQIEFYNAYPYYNKRLYLPTPQHLRINKHIWRKEKTALSVGNEKEFSTVKLKNLSTDEKSEKDKNTLEYRFLARKNGEHLVGIKVAKEYRLHHNTSRRPGEIEKENLFRYQAMRAGQCFRAIIRFDESLIESMEAVLRKTFTIYLGGAKGSGYGLCQVQPIGGELSDYRAAKKLVGLHDEPYLESENQLVITCLSDCLCRNEYGQPINHIPESYLKGICGQSVILGEKQFIQTGITEGYNTTWKARYPKETTLRAGSVLVYKLEKEQNEDELKNIIHALESQLIGHRTQDGFGWIGVNIPYGNSLVVQEDKPIVEINSDNINEDMLWHEIQQDEKCKEVMNILLSGLQKSKENWLNMICLKSWSSNEAIGDARRKASRDSFVISTDLKSNHFMSMLKILKVIMDNKEVGDKNATYLANSKVLMREYAKDKELCSIANYNFSEIIDYLNSPSFTIQDDKYKNLKEFAENKLNSQKGRIFYWEENQEKKFIAELLQAGLSIQHRRKI